MTCLSVSLAWGCVWVGGWVVVGVALWRYLELAGVQPIESPAVASSLRRMVDRAITPLYQAVAAPLRKYGNSNIFNSSSKDTGAASSTTAISSSSPSAAAATENGDVEAMDVSSAPMDQQGGSSSGSATALPLKPSEVFGPVESLASLPGRLVGVVAGYLGPYVAEDSALFAKLVRLLRVRQAPPHHGQAASRSRRLTHLLLLLRLIIVVVVVVVGRSTTSLPRRVAGCRRRPRTRWRRRTSAASWGRRCCPDSPCSAATPVRSIHTHTHTSRAADEGANLTWLLLLWLGWSVVWCAALVQELWELLSRMGWRLRFMLYQ